jgi:glycerol-3-phosphate acyltransferase PlsY
MIAGRGLTLDLAAGIDVAAGGHLPLWIALAASYLLGSVPFAYLAGAAAGIDLRQHGSGNLGATNVVRVLGWKVGIPVFALDVAKGAAPVLLLPRWIDTPRPDLWAMAFGLLAMLGHVRPLFLWGRGGGKGVATAAGVFLALAPIPMIFTLGVFAIVLITSGYVSLGSLLASVTLVATLAIFEGVRSPHFLVSLAVAVFVFWTHRANIGRLRRGEENRFGRRHDPEPEAAPAPVDGRGGR